jgi:hypothetical protein
VVCTTCCSAHLDFRLTPLREVSALQKQILHEQMKELATLAKGTSIQVRSCPESGAIASRLMLLLLLTLRPPSS